MFTPQAFSRTELGAVAGLGMYGTCSARDRAAEARRAHEMLESSAAKGKLVLVP